MVTPTPRKLALLMSLAGLGLSLGDAAFASNDPTARARLVTSLGLPARADEADAGTTSGDEMSAFILPGTLDRTLVAADEALAPISQDDRAAMALAMVLMADPPPLYSASVSMPAAFLPTEHWELGAVIPNDLQDDIATARHTAQAHSADPKVDSLADPADPLSAIEVPVGKSAVVPAPAAKQGSSDVLASGSDLDLDLGSSWGVDLNLELGPGLDLNLDLGSGLDLNLDLGPALDLRLDRLPASLAPSMHRTSRPRQQSPADSVWVTDASMNVAATASAPRIAMPAEAMVAAPESATIVEKKVVVTQARVRQATKPRVAVVAGLRGVKSGGGTVRPTRPAARLPEIVVASHADRVLRSLEALLSGGDSAGGHLGAQTEEIFAASHAEKARLTLASMCRSDDLPRLGENVDQRLAGLGEAPAPPEAALAAPASSEGRREATERAETAQPVRRSALGDELLAVNESKLDKVRGGFESNGLQISFGIERAVYINGALVTSTSLNVSDLGKASGGQSPISSVSSSPGGLTLIQNGAGNVFLSGPVSAANVGTVIQNTLNDQKIQTVTAINATVNSLQLVRSQNFQSSLRGAIIDSLRR